MCSELYPDLEVLVPEEQCQEAIREMAAWIYNKYYPENILLVGVLKGAYVTLALLGIELAKLGYRDVHFEFVGIKTQDTDEPTFYHDPQTNIRRRRVVVVEDVEDTRRTLRILLELFLVKEPESLAVCVLVDKSECAQVELPPDIDLFASIRLPGSPYIVGMGLDDSHQNDRHLPVIAVRRE